MHYADIQAGLIKAGYPTVKLAESLDRHPSTVSEIIHGKKKSYLIASRISQILKKPVSEIWPGIYDNRAA